MRLCRGRRGGRPRFPRWRYHYEDQEPCDRPHHGRRPMGDRLAGPGRGLRDVRIERHLYRPDSPVLGSPELQQHQAGGQGSERRVLIAGRRSHQECPHQPGPPRQRLLAFQARKRIQARSCPTRPQEGIRGEPSHFPFLHPWSAAGKLQLIHYSWNE